MNGLAISSIPSSGETNETCVPLITTSPSLRIWSVNWVVSSGSYLKVTYTNEINLIRKKLMFIYKGINEHMKFHQISQKFSR